MYTDLVLYAVLVVSPETEPPVVEVILAVMLEQVIEHIVEAETNELVTARDAVAFGLNERDPSVALALIPAIPTASVAIATTEAAIFLNVFFIFSDPLKKSL